MFGRAWLWVREQFAFLAVLVVLVATFLYALVAPHRTGRASVGIATAMLLAALLRAVLPTPRAGLLVVRNRVFDAACYLVLGVVVLVVEVRLHA
jgi:hypothetical protein